MDELEEIKKRKLMEMKEKSRPREGSLEPKIMFIGEAPERMIKHYKKEKKVAEETIEKIKKIGF